MRPSRDDATDDNDIPALDAQLEVGGRGVGTESNLCHALATEHDELGNCQQASAFWCAANGASAARRPATHRNGPGGTHPVEPGPRLVTLNHPCASTPSFMFLACLKTVARPMLSTRAIYAAALRPLNAPLAYR